jgi:hypothetical protein
MGIAQRVGQSIGVATPSAFQNLPLISCSRIVVKGALLACQEAILSCTVPSNSRSKGLKAFSGNQPPNSKEEDRCFTIAPVAELYNEHLMIQTANGESAKSG